MLLRKRIRLKPTPEQERQFIKCCGVARWAYNLFIEENNKIYSEYLKNDRSGNSYISGSDVRKKITQMKATTHTWLKEVGCNVPKQSIRDAEKAYKEFFNGTRGRPKFKSKHKSKMSFYVNSESLSRGNYSFHGERIGNIKTAEQLPKLPDGKHYGDPRIKFDGKYWYLSFTYEVDPIECDHTDEILGIDVGIKELAVCSNETVYHNINKTERVRKLEKSLKRAQRSLSRMLEDNTASYKVIGKNRYPIYKRPISECKNIQKQSKKIRLIYRKLRNIREDYTHKVTTEIVRTKPSRIVMEDLNVIGMMKNRYLAKSVQDQSWSGFHAKMKYKCELYGIEFVEASRWFPSSKMCSCCGAIKSDLKLRDRTYHCTECGLEIDRDYNASLNLANYVNC